jgi:hypothetical protein
MGTSCLSAASRRGRGRQVWYLPTYSRNLSPIELAFAKFKDLVRWAATRMREALEQAVADVWAQV